VLRDADEIALSFALGSQEDQAGLGFHASFCSTGGDNGYAGFDFECFLVNRHQAFTFKEVIRSRLAGMNRDLSTGFQANHKGLELGCLDQELRLGAVCGEDGFRFYVWKVDVGHMLLFIIDEGVYTACLLFNLRWRKDGLSGDDYNANRT
jgi:hypothetical protein